MRSNLLYTSPQDAERAFYEAFQAADLEAMMAVWAEDEEVYCVHPGGPRLSSLPLIRESWRQIFSSGASMRFQIAQARQTKSGLVAVHSVYEYITVAGEGRARHPVVATNIYLNTELGWRMLAHHASPIAGEAPPAPDAPAKPSVLH